MRIKIKDNDFVYEFKRIFVYPVKGFIESLQRSCFWAKKMWNNYDFDAMYMLDMEIIKLERIATVFEKHGHLENSDTNAEKIREILSKQTGLTKAKSVEFHKRMWLYANGLATLIATNEIKIEEQEILVKLVKFYKILVKGE